MKNKRHKITALDFAVNQLIVELSEAFWERDGFCGPLKRRGLNYTTDYRGSETVVEVPETHKLRGYSAEFQRVVIAYVGLPENFYIECLFYSIHNLRFPVDDSYYGWWPAYGKCLFGTNLIEFTCEPVLLSGRCTIFLSDMKDSGST